MADGLNKKMDLAGRLVNGLSGENKRWGDNVVTLSKEAVMLIGNVMMASSFVSYIGPFDFR
jgi:dynein heavy chain